MKNLNGKLFISTIIGILITIILLILESISLNYIKLANNDISNIINDVRFIVRFNIFSVSIMCGSIFIFVLIFFLFANKRVKYIINSVVKIENEDFLPEIEVKGNDEFAKLAQSINVMSYRIEEKFNKEKEIENSKHELITAVSHDLKTPLTSIIGYLELLKKKNIKILIREKSI